jgi:co-chaperonin GroES (HSP10)
MNAYGNYVFVKRDKTPTVSRGGIILPELIQSEIITGVVTSSAELKTGAKVLISKHGVLHEFVDNIVVVHIDNILGVEE